MWNKIKRWLGIYNLRVECAEYVKSVYGEECVDDFLRIYDNVGDGIPVAMQEAVAAIDVVETVKKKMREQTLWYKCWNK